MWRSGPSLLSIAGEHLPKPARSDHEEDHELQRCDNEEVLIEQSGNCCGNCATVETVATVQLCGNSCGNSVATVGTVATAVETVATVQLCGNSCGNSVATVGTVANAVETVATVATGVRCSRFSFVR